MAQACTDSTCNPGFWLASLILLLIEWRSGSLTRRPLNPPFTRPDIERADKPKETFDSSQINQAPLGSYAYLRTSDRQNRLARPPSSSQSHKFSQPSVPQRDERQHRQTIDSFQRDYAPVAASGASLLAKANQEGDVVAEHYRQRKEAYERRDHPRAKELPEKGKRHTLKMDRLHAAASATISKGDFISISPWPI